MLHLGVRVVRFRCRVYHHETPPKFNCCGFLLSPRSVVLFSSSISTPCMNVKHLSSGQDLIILVTDLQPKTLHESFLGAKTLQESKIPAGRLGLKTLPKKNLIECTYSSLQEAYQEFGEHPVNHLGFHIWHASFCHAKWIRVSGDRGFTRLEGRAHVFFILWIFSSRICVCQILVDQVGAPIAGLWSMHLSLAMPTSERASCCAIMWFVQRLCRMSRSGLSVARDFIS